MADDDAQAPSGPRPVSPLHALRAQVEALAIVLEHGTTLESVRASALAQIGALLMQIDALSAAFRPRQPERPKVREWPTFDGGIRPVGGEVHEPPGIDVDATGDIFRTRPEGG
jgi:hypothetical protein